MAVVLLKKPIRFAHAAMLWHPFRGRDVVKGRSKTQSLNLAWQNLGNSCLFLLVENRAGSPWDTTAQHSVHRTGSDFLQVPIDWET
jgi:hypothetical protein